MTPLLHDEVNPYIMYRDVSFAYHNQVIGIRSEKDEFGTEMFLLTLNNRIFGYFEPDNN